MTMKYRNWLTMLAAVVSSCIGIESLAQFPPPPPPPGMAPVIVTFTLNHLAKNDGATLWAYLDVVGT